MKVQMFLPYVNKKVERLLKLNEEYKFKIYWDGSSGMDKINTCAPQGGMGLYWERLSCLGKGYYGDILAELLR